MLPENVGAKGLDTPEISEIIKSYVSRASKAWSLAAGCAVKLLEYLALPPEARTWAATTAFIGNVALLAHSEYKLNRLEDMTSKIEAEITRLRERGGVVEFKTESSLEALYTLIWKVVDAKSNQKAELLGRVVLNGLIPMDDAEVERRDIQRAIDIVEPQDIEMLREYIAAEDSFNNDKSNSKHVTKVKTVIFKEHEERWKAPTSNARLFSAALIDLEPNWGGRQVTVTDLGRKFLPFLKLEG